MYFHLIPGNPGTAEFYVEFQLMLSHKHNIPINHIHIAHHPGHSVSTIHETALGLEALIEYHVEQMMWMYGGDATVTTPIHLMGHSIGGYVVLRIANAMRRTHPHISKRLNLHLICPTILHMKDVPEGRRWDLWRHTLVESMSHMIQWIPLVMAYMAVPHHAMGSIWHKQVVDNTLMLWADEREMVQAMPVLFRLKS